MKKNRSIRRIFHRICEEIISTYKVSKVLTFHEAIITLIAKIDIQIMNHNGYRETKSMTKHLLKKHEIMLKYFEKTFDKFIKDYRFNMDRLPKSQDLSDCIWICWWQGIENAPDIVKRCIESIRKNAGNHQVIILTENNYKDYVNIPYWVEEKKEKGVITMTNYSDLLRLSLLAEHGGMWLDATFFCTQPCLDQYFQMPLWSIKRPDYGHASVASGYFAGYSLSCNYDNRWIFASIRDYFLHYWETNDTMVDYLLVDYMIVLVQRHNKEIENKFKKIPSNNSNCDELFKVLKMPFDCSKWNVIKEKTCLFKLSWKQSFNVKVDSKKTFYGKIIDKEL